MKQLLIELEDELAAKLEEVAPTRSRKRSEFIRSAIRRALWALEEAATAEAYRRMPDATEEVYVDPSVWERVEPKRSRRAKK